MIDLDLDLERDGDVHVLRFDDGENRFGPAFLDAVHTAPTPAS